jgi:hypothetical protein
MCSERYITRWTDPQNLARLATLHSPDRVAILAVPSARGGIGRRARLRALWTNSPWWFESTRAHLGSPALRGFFVARLVYLTVPAALPPRGNNFGSSYLYVCAELTTPGLRRITRSVDRGPQPKSLSGESVICSPEHARRRIDARLPLVRQTRSKLSLSGSPWTADNEAHGRRPRPG